MTSQQRIDATTTSRGDVDLFRQNRRVRDLSSKVANLAKFPKDFRGNPALKAAGWPAEVLCPSCLDWVDRDLLIVFSRLDSDKGLKEGQDIVVGHAKEGCLYIFSPNPEYWELLKKLNREEDADGD